MMSRNVPVLLLVLIGVIALFVPFAPAPVHATGCPQSISATSTTSTRELGETGGVQVRLAQSFTVPCGGTLSAVRVRFNANTGSPTAPVTWNIKADEYTLPGVVITTGTFTPTASAVNTITLGSAVSLNEGGVYWFELVSPTQSAGNRWNVNSSANSTSVYAGGTLLFSTNAGVAWTDTAADMYIQMTFGLVTATSTPASTSTPADTATPTITPSPTPNYLIEVTSTAGAPMALERTATYGDLTTFGGLLIVAGVLFFIFVYTYWRDRARAGIDS